MVNTKVNNSLVVRNRGLINFGRARRGLKNETQNLKTQGKRLKEIESEIQSKIKAATFTFGETNEQPQLPGVSFATGGMQQRNSRIPATNGKTPIQAVRREV